MGIRKGWALCGAREKHCFISHAVSSHPLLELQTLRLSMRSSAHHQDQPLDSIQKKLCIFPFLSTCLFSLLFLPSPLLHMPPSPLIRRQEPFLPFIISLTSPEDEDRASGGTCDHPAYFFVTQRSLLTTSLWVSFLILHMQMIWERWEGGPFGFNAPSFLTSSSLLIVFFSLGWEGVVCLAEARWEILGMGSH